MGSWFAPVVGAAAPENMGSQKPGSARSVDDSVFATYQGYIDAPIVSWPQANAEVQAIGGWRAYAKEVYRARASKPTTPPASVGKP
jgi:hypothetical protein